MPEHLERFLALPTVPTPFTWHGETVAFIIDPLHTAQAWTALRQRDMRYDFDQLFVGTRNAAGGAEGEYRFTVVCEAIGKVLKLFHDECAQI